MKEDEQTSAVKFNIQIVWESLPQATTFQGLAVASSLTTYPGHPRENTSDGMEFLNHKMLSKTKPPIIFQQLLKWSQPNLPSWYNSWLGPCRDLQNKCLELVMSIQFFIRSTCETFCEKLGIPLNAHMSAYFCIFLHHMSMPWMYVFWFLWMIHMQPLCQMLKVWKNTTKACHSISVVLYMRKQ